MRELLCVVGFLAVHGLGLAQAPVNFKPPESKKPDAAALKAIDEKTDKLKERLESLRRRGVADSLRVEVEIYLKAATWIVQENEFWNPDSAAWTQDVLDHGLLRAAQLGQGEVLWPQEKGHAVIRGFRSRIDGSIQPYAMTLPADYGKDVARKWRIDVVLHGRDATLNEVKFLHQHDGGTPASKEDLFVRLDLFSRGNLGYRWAGETDVNEALEHFFSSEKSLGRLNLLDPGRVVVRGFSMGGAGAWHLGLHQPSRWAVIGPGAGFVTTHGYAKALSATLPSYQEACLHIYDALDYAENAAHVPIVAYAGANDPEAQAGKAIKDRLKPLGIPMTFLVAPGLKDEFPPEWKKKAEAEYARFVERGRPEYVPHVRFVTYTLKYNTCEWLTLLALDRHYEQARVDAEGTETGYVVKTQNVGALRIDLPSGATRHKAAVTIDGQSLNVRPYLASAGSLHLYLRKKEDRWLAVLPERLEMELQRRPRKVQGLNGPIDEAFCDAFVCVKGTGRPWHEETQKYAEQELERFRRLWSRNFRGDLPIKNDDEVTPDDIASRSLILFGDPSSNSILAQVADALPLTWTREKIVLAGVDADAAAHVPVLIYPSPLQAGRYIVLNTGVTFGTPDLEGTSAQLFPKLGDYALLKITADQDNHSSGEVLVAGLFDDYWQIPKKEPSKTEPRRRSGEKPGP